MEELQGVGQESNRQLGEKTVRLEEAEAQVQELQEALEVSRERSESLERSPRVLNPHETPKALFWLAQSLPSAAP